MEKKSKYFTDKTFLVELLEENEEKVKIKIVDCNSHNINVRQNIGKVLDYDRIAFYKMALPYDLDDPLKKEIPAGKCYCESCGKELKLGEECIKYNGMVFCCQGCLEDYLGYELSQVYEDDLDNSTTIEVPMFDYKG